MSLAGARAAAACAASINVQQLSTPCVPLGAAVWLTVLCALVWCVLLAAVILGCLSHMFFLPLVPYLHQGLKE